MSQIIRSRGYDDPFLYLGKIFIHFGYEKIPKYISVFYFILCLFDFLLQIFFIVNKFSVDVITTYGPLVLVLTNILVVMGSALVMEGEILKIVDECNSSFWSTDSVGPEVQHFIKEKSAQTTYLLLSIYAVLLISSAVMFPVFGNHCEWNACEVAFDHYFGVGSKILCQLAFWSTPIICYAGLRFTGTLIYVTEGLGLQIFLINQRILQVCDDHPDFNKLKIGQEILWQNKIFRTILSCIKHHIFIVTMFKKLLGIMKSRIILIVITGVLGAIALVFFVMNIFENSSTILKLRLGFLSIGAIVVIVLYCQAGQKISDQMEEIFDTLTQCSWYNWDANNKQILLIFMAHSLQRCSLTFAGFSVDYKQGVSAMRTSFNYGLIVYHLGILNDHSKVN